MPASALSGALRRPDHGAFPDRLAAFGAKTHPMFLRALPRSAGDGSPGRHGNPPPSRRDFWMVQLRPASTGVVRGSRSWPYRQSPASRRSESRAARPARATSGSASSDSTSDTAERCDGDLEPVLTGVVRSGTATRRCRPAGRHRCRGTPARRSRDRAGPSPGRPRGPWTATSARSSRSSTEMFAGSDIPQVGDVVLLAARVEDEGEPVPALLGDHQVVDDAAVVVGEHRVAHAPQRRGWRSRPAPGFRALGPRRGQPGGPHPCG